MRLGHPRLTLTFATVFFHDATERPIQRPKDPEAQKAYYSGKKKQHIVKNNLMTNAESKIVLLTPSCEGRIHDKRIAETIGYSPPSGSILYQDSGFKALPVRMSTSFNPKRSRKVNNSRLKKRQRIARFCQYAYALNMLLAVSKDTASSKISCATPKKGSATWSWRLAVGYITFG